MNRKRAILIAIVTFLSLIIFRPSRPSAATLENCPISLTNPDGQAMALVKYDLRAAVHGALSLVEMAMTFRNSENRQMEGRFTYTLPPGATISRFAKEVNGKLMEGEVVERMRAQQIYTEILHTMRDPALLEMDQGNKFSARVFPVPANGTVRLLLAFSKPLPMKDGVRKLTIPLAGLPKIGEFNFSAIGKPLDSETATGVVLDKEEPLGEDLSAFSRHSVDYTPTKDIELTFVERSSRSVPAANGAGTPSNVPGQNGAGAPFHLLRAGNFQMVQFLYNPPPVTTIATAAPPDWSFYFDTSASGADTEAPRLQVIERLLQNLVPVFGGKTNQRIGAHAFDIEVVELQPDVKITDPFADNVVHKLRARHALGATNLEALFKSIGERARANQNACTYVLVSDGIATWGARETKDLLAALGDWPAKDTLHALVIGNKQDEKTLGAIVEKTRGRVVMLPLTTDIEGNVTKAIADLRAPLGAHFDAYDEGTAWIYPKSFHDVRPGQELIAFSEIRTDGGKSLPGFVQRDAAGKTIKDTQVSIAPIEVADFAPLLQREAYKAYLDYLEKEEQAQTDAMKRKEIHQKRIDISVKNRVMCPLTSLLVLETERDYARFGITRNSLADIMVVGRTGIELRKRSAEEMPVLPPVTTPAKPAPHDQFKREFESKKSADAKADKDISDLTDGTALRLERAEGLAEREVVEQAPGGGGRGGRAYRDGEARIDAVEDRAAANTPVAHAAEPEARAALRELATDARQRTADAPAPGTPPPAPPAERLARQREATGGANGFAAVQMNAGDWINQLDSKSYEAQLSDLRARVEANPRDRRSRNAYADALLKTQKWDNLQAEVFQWLPFDPENPAVYEFLGKSATGMGDNAMALRAYSSIAEIAPNRAALLNRAGFLLLTAKKYDLAEAMFREALKNRQDDSNIYRGLALSLYLAGNYDGAATAYETALMRDFNQRYGDVKRVLREEYGYVLRAWRKKEPAKSDAIVTRAEKAGVDLLRVDALRVTMCWETDANDVDLHIVDPNGEECFYSHKNNASGLELYSDQTQGLGPEVIRTDKTLAGTYHVGVNYFSAGPMGVSRGIVVIMKPVDGIDENPQIIPFALIEGGKEMRYVGSVAY